MKKIALALFLSIAACHPAYSGGHSEDGYGDFEPPAAYITPQVRNFSGKEVQTGWSFVYYNFNRFSTTNDIEPYEQAVTLPDGSEGLITWSVIHTPNAPCVNEDLPLTHEKCADTVFITGVPEGYVAVPDQMVIPENRSQQALIIPEVFG